MEQPDAYKAREEAREALKGKALKYAYEIATEIEKAMKTKLAFEQSDFIFRRIVEAAMDGFASGMLLSYRAIITAFHRTE